MKYPKCRTCGKEHALGGCPEFKNRSHAVGPAMGAKGGAVLSGGDNQRDEAGATPAMLQVATDTLPKPKMGRPRTGYIKAEYNRQYSADQRTIKRLGLQMTVAEWRKSKET